jgi:RNA polymerase sigma factor (sigma-70 family)
MGVDVAASDQRLVAEVNAGSERAFEMLFNRHQRPVLAFCRHMLGSREEAEDALQQTFLTAYREIARGEQPSSLRPWLYAIARHRCLSELRGRRRRSVEAMPEPGADHVLTQIATREDLRAVLADVTRLPYDQRAALVLAELGDISHEEIAGIVGCPREKVKALVFQARAALTAGRAAREISCSEVQEQLATLRGGALRRSVLRRHLHDCPGCRAFRDKTRVGRRRLGLLLPAPWGLKRTVLGALLGSGSGGGGSALTAGALGALALAVSISVGPAAEDKRLVPHGGAPEQVALNADSSTPRAGAARDRVRPAGSANTVAGVRMPSAPPRANAQSPRAAEPEQPRAREAVDPPGGTDAAEPSRPERPAEPSELPAGRPARPANPPKPTPGGGRATPAKPPKPTPAHRRATPAKPPKPTPANRRATPAGRPSPDHRIGPAEPPAANRPVAPGNRPTAPGEAKPPRPDGHTPPAAALESARGPSANPSHAGADPPVAHAAAGHGGDVQARPAPERPHAAAP